MAVAAFLAERLSFLGISDTVLRVTEEMPHAKDAHTLDEILAIDREARERATQLIASAEMG